MNLPRIFTIPKTLYQTKSPISGEIKVVQQGPERRLLINGVKQSVNPDAPNMDKRYWPRVAELAYKNRWRQIESILVLGLGGGTVCHFLEAKFPGVLVDGVELDPLVIEAGEKFFELGKLKCLNTLCADAHEVIHRPIEFDLRSSRYDLILVDVFSGGKVPGKFTRPEFFDKLRRFLHLGGMVIFNQAARDPKHLDLESFVERISRCFSVIGQEEVGAELGFSNFLISGCRV